MLLKGLAQEGVDLNNGFNAYFLPGNMDQADGAILAVHLENEILIETEPSVYSSVSGGSDESAFPASFRLCQNFPNPFNHSTTIRFFLLTAEHLVIKVFDIRGNEIRTLANQMFSAGDHKLFWDGLDRKGQELASGFYIYRVESDEQIMQKKMLMIK